MISKNQIKQINSLKIKKNRQDLHLFIAEGEKVVAELIQSTFIVKQIFALKSWLDNNIKLLNPKVELYEVSASELVKISNLSTPNEVLAVVEIPKKTAIDKNTLQNKLVLVLDQIKDPGNFGTIIRIADWFGIENIICSEDSVDTYNSKVVQATMGSLYRVNILYTNLIDFIESFESNYPIYGAVLGGENLYHQKLTKNGLIVLGNESKGISTDVLKLVSKKIEIPKFGNAESLNVGIAAAIICSEFKRN